MLESRQSTQVGYYLDFSFSERVCNLVKRVAGNLVYILMPEDSSRIADREHQALTAQPEKTARGALKVLFWYVVAITFTVMLSRLH